MQVIRNSSNLMVNNYKLDRIKQPGTRLTGQRRLIFEIINRSDSHLDADEIYGEARKEKPRISLSTVYRALGKFKEMGLIAEYHLGQEHHHYESRQSSPHHHFICQKCGLISEFEFPIATQIKKNVPQLRGCEIIRTEVNMSGLCPRCRK